MILSSGPPPDGRDSFPDRPRRAANLLFQGRFGPSEDHEGYVDGSTSGRASLKVIENTPVRVRILQKCHPRSNNDKGPPGDPFVVLDMVETMTEWTFYPTGRGNFKFDAIMAPDWDGICSHEPGGG